MNTTTQKNELIFGYSSGNLGEAKSLFTSMYLYLNSLAARKTSIFNNLLAQNLDELEGVKLKKLKYSDCIKSKQPTEEKVKSIKLDEWKEIYNFLLNHFAENDRDMRTLRKFTYISSGITNTIHLKDYETAINMLNKARDLGYIISD